MNNDDFQKMSEILDAAVRSTNILPYVSIALSVISLVLSVGLLLFRLGVLS